MSRGNLHMWNPMQERPSTEWEAEVDRLHRMAKYEPDFEKRKAIINDMFYVLYENLPLIPTVRKYIFNVVYNDFANVNWDIWTEVGGYNNLRVFKK
jgi:peptide/nickel transport system substrate-binding protein